MPLPSKEKKVSPEPVVSNTVFNGWPAGKCAVTWDGWGVAGHVCSKVSTDFMLPQIMQRVMFTSP